MSHLSLFWQSFLLSFRSSSGIKLPQRCSGVQATAVCKRASSADKLKERPARLRGHDNCYAVGHGKPCAFVTEERLSPGRYTGGNR